MSSSDRFPLKPTGEKICLTKWKFGFQSLSSHHAQQESRDSCSSCRASRCSRISHLQPENGWLSGCSFSSWLVGWLVGGLPCHLWGMVSQKIGAPSFQGKWKIRKVEDPAETQGIWLTFSRGEGENPQISGRSSRNSRDLAKQTYRGDPAASFK